MLFLSIFHSSELHVQLGTDSIIYEIFASFMHNMFQSQLISSDHTLFLEGVSCKIVNVLRKGKTSDGVGQLFGSMHIWVACHDFEIFLNVLGLSILRHPGLINTSQDHVDALGGAFTVKSVALFVTYQRRAATRLELHKNVLIQGNDASIGHRLLLLFLAEPRKNLVLDCIVLLPLVIVSVQYTWKHSFMLISFTVIFDIGN